ncbi:hypothetical protein Tco_0880390 [Tanacetum coccineum]
MKSSCNNYLSTHSHSFLLHLNDSTINTNPHTNNNTKAPSSTTIFPVSETLSAIQLRVSELEKEVKELKQADHSTTIHALIRSQVPTVVNEYLGSNARTEFDQKEIFFHMMRKNMSYEKHPTHQVLYDALMQSLIMDKDEMKKAKTVEPPTQKKRKHDDKDQDPPAGPDQRLKKSKDGEPSKKPTSVGFSKGTTQSQQKSTGKSFKKPARPPTPDPEWNTRKSADDGLEQSWLNDLANAEKPPLTFDDLMSTPINFFDFAMNRLKISKFTKVDLVGPVYNLLKGTCKSCVELKYNIKECYRALSDQLDWNNPEGNHCPYGLSKPLLLQESQGRLTTKAKKYEMEGIEDMVPKQWSLIKVAYDKYTALGISHWEPKRQRFYRYVINRVSRHDVYLTMGILSVTSVTVDKWYGLWLSEGDCSANSRLETLQVHGGRLSKTSSE